MFEPEAGGRGGREAMSPNTLMVMSLFAKADVMAAAAAGAATAALAMFLLTISLVIRGAAPGYEVGPHLSAFMTFWPGYSVSVGGSVVGAFYASLIGAVLGFVTGVFWNFTHLIIIGAAVLRGEWLEAE
ncbi:MAG: hypothetical protein GC189_03550 [Alphaproteobacteria bacterium]|nr:hypothetical protein [Alphaproteobacteria bacterium]